MGMIRLGVVLLMWSLIVGCFPPESSNNQDQRLTASDAEIMFECSFVKSATNFWLYEKIGGLQSLDRYVRFEVLRLDITNQLNLMILGNNKLLKRKLSYNIKQFDASKIRTPPATETKLSWWTPESITNGICVEENEAYALHIWIDCSNGRFYVQQND